MEAENKPAPPVTPFYLHPSFIASAVILLIFLVKLLPFAYVQLFVVRGGFSGLQTINFLGDNASGIYYLFYLIPVAAIYLVAFSFIPDGPAKGYSNAAKWIVFGGLVGYLLLRLINVGGIAGGFVTIGIGYYIALLASLFLPFETKMLDLVRKGTEKVQQKAAD